MRLSAAPERARVTVQQALDIAQGPRETSQALLALTAMDRDRDPSLRLRRLRRLADEFGMLDVECVVMPLPETEGQAAAYRYVPVDALSVDMLPSEAGSRGDWETVQLPLGLWARFESVEAIGPPDGTSRKHSPFADLYAILRLYAERDWLGSTAGESALRLIQAYQKQSGWSGMEPIEHQAEQALELAIERGGDYELARIQSLYPLTGAADRAGDARVASAAQQGDIGVLAEVILGSAPLEYALERTSPKTRQQLALLAQTVGEAGGLTFRAELGKRLAASAPRQPITLLGGITRSLDDWSLEWSAQVPVPRPAPDPTFTASLRLLEADHEIVPGASLWVPPAIDAQGLDKPAPPITLMTWRDPAQERLTVAAFSEDLRPVWVTPMRPYSTQLDGQAAREDGGREPAWVASPGRVHAPTRTGVLTLDRERGTRLWRWTAGVDYRLMNLQGAQGVLVATLEDRNSGKGQDASWLQVGLEAASGTELWRRRLAGDSYHPAPLVGGSAVVLLSTGTRPCQIFDLFSGAEGPRLRPARMRAKTLLAAWIDGGRILFPYFAKKDNQALNHIEAFDLSTGQKVWRLPFGKTRELVRVLRANDQTYLELRGYAGDNVTQYVEFFPLDVERGTLPRQATIQMLGDILLIGVPKFARRELSHPWLFARTSRPGGYGIQALHLRRGSKWETNLGEHISPVSPTSLPQPQVSGQAAVLALPKRGTNKSSYPSTYYILTYDKETGRPVSDLMVRISSRRGQSPAWSALGSQLVFGHVRDSEVLGSSK